MQITEVRIALQPNHGALKAFASITIDNSVVVHGIKVVETITGRPFVSMPSIKRADGSHQEVVHAINNVMRHELHRCVLEAYAKAVRSA